MIDSDDAKYYRARMPKAYRFKLLKDIQHHTSVTYQLIQIIYKI